ncbi:MULTISPECIES: SPOR domain-containing protein [Cyanophyceae]|uniref:SPOR domain-containing protein n=1 Tax=Cyanophyceae TaxID=3028117 RepID=UPI001687FDE8|nr:MULTISPECIES: SPOR domain-containing protein [Cyanophyceae]MBD1915159.1 SPOR domain-containing protein [Phormidium sp. FACHB-77]MBD2030922.1 SPOR domain-containing protein [Phormidium sp. FACHB-322]MBD2050731.1 SPOR domain-containing protein [Leptolyngbya sp. FACHB-60]
MTQLPSGLSTRPETFAPASESHLRLQRAVESLNLNLDDELHRYRQARSGQATPTPARLQLRTHRKPIDLITVKSTAAAGAAAAAAPPPNARLEEILGQSSAPNAQTYPPQASVHQVRMSHGGTITTYRPSPEDYLESTEALLGSLPTAAPHDREPDYTPSLRRQLTTPLGVGALLLLLVTSAGFGYLVTSPEAIQHLTDNAITRRFKGDPAPVDNADSVALDSLGSQAESGFKPLGPDLSEKEFASLDLNNISTLPSANSPKSPAASAALPPTTAPAMVGGQPLPTNDQRPGEPRTTGPRPGVLTPAGGSGGVLRAEIVTAPRAAVSPRPAVTAAPARSAPAPTRSAPAPVAASPVRVAPPAAPARPPQPLAANRASAAPPAPVAPPAVAPPAPITQAPPQAAAPSYYVVTDYNGTQSLESARSAVGDAYVRDFSGGTRIQMGAFSQPSSAQNLVNELEGQGIPAQVISP